MQELREIWDEIGIPDDQVCPIISILYLVMKICAYIIIFQ